MTTEDITVVMFRTDAGVAGSVVISQVSPGRKNQLQLEVAGSEATLSFDQEQPERLWVGRRRLRPRSSCAIPRTSMPAAARLAVPAPGHAQGYADCFAAFVADTYRAITTGEPPSDGLPTSTDGARTAHIIDAVLSSAEAGDARRRGPGTAV